MSKTLGASFSFSMQMTIHYAILSGRGAQKKYRGCSLGFLRFPLAFSFVLLPHATLKHRLGSHTSGIHGAGQTREHHCFFLLFFVRRLTSPEPKTADFHI